jgi:hypothetical protein
MAKIGLRELLAIPSPILAQVVSDHRMIESREKTARRRSRLPFQSSVRAIRRLAVRRVMRLRTSGNE